jgi:uncharacterized protein YbdZ (MbtH family)
MTKRKKVSARRRLELRDAQNVLGHLPQDIPRDAVYNDMKPISVNTRQKLTEHTMEQADALFDSTITSQARFRNVRVTAKRTYFRSLVQTGQRAMHGHHCIMIPRNKNHPEFSKLRQQVIDCAVDSGLFFEHRSPKGAPKMSRLLPTAELSRMADTDPWAFDPQTEEQFVFLRNREDKRDLLVDLAKLPSWHIAVETQRRLELINYVNTHFDITYSPYLPLDFDFARGRKRLRPVHKAIFTDDWDKHGRLYTGRYGHQSLRKIERKTIQFLGFPAVELDFSGLHTRILYHLKQIDFQEDPYKLWGKKTTPAQRHIAKTLLNVALNAPSREATINRCRLETSNYTGGNDERGQPLRKRGLALEQAHTLRLAYRRTGLSWEAIYDLALKRHAPIADKFSSDAGLFLMRIDSSIALDVLYEFANQGLPCLSCHDSFIVAEQYASELRAAMMQFYFDRLNFWPVIK